MMSLEYLDVTSVVWRAECHRRAKLLPVHWLIICSLRWTALQIFTQGFICGRSNVSHLHYLRLTRLLCSNLLEGSCNWNNEVHIWWIFSDAYFFDAGLEWNKSEQLMQSLAFVQFGLLSYFECCWAANSRIFFGTKNKYMHLIPAWYKSSISPSRWMINYKLGPIRFFLGPVRYTYATGLQWVTMCLWSLQCSSHFQPMTFIADSSWAALHD